jgi:predicted esterase
MDILPRILVLHGYTQSCEVIREKLVKHLPNAQYIVTNAPLKLEEEGDGKYGWFPLSKANLQEDNVIVTEDDVSLLANHFINLGWNGHYDAVIAYSQGCLATQILLDRQIIYSDKLLYFCPIPLPPKPLLTLPCTIKTRIYLGEGDVWVPETNTSFLDYHSKSHQECANTENLVIKRHSKGHTIPINKTFREEYAAFLFPKDAASSDDIMKLIRLKKSIVDSLE